MALKTIKGILWQLNGENASASICTEGPLVDKLSLYFIPHYYFLFTPKPIKLIIFSNTSYDHYCDEF